MDRCELCKFYRRLKHNLERGKGFVESHCCDILYHIDDKDGWIQEVTPDSMCEMFTRREK